VQMLGSALAAFAAIAAGLLSHSRLMRVLAVALVVILAGAYVDYNRAFYDLGFGRVAYPSLELRALFLNADLVGLPLWFVSGYLVRWASRRRSGGAGDGRAGFCEAPAATIDGPFF